MKTVRFVPKMLSDGPQPLFAHLQDQYLEVTQPLDASDRVYGLGERTPSAGLELLRDGLPYTLWAHDIGAENPDQNLYGSHPMLLIVHAGASCRPCSCADVSELFC